MKSSTMRARLLASSMICGAAMLGLASQASAQATGEVEELVVTGTRIPQPNLNSTSPVTVVGAQDIKLQGVVRTEDLLNSLPQVFSTQGSSISNGASGTATVALRGLGAERTLVLINGRRVVPGDPATPVTDLNFIPAPLIERVDVLTGGASAVYGSDAVAGVVNFLMMKDYEGIRLDAQVGYYQHNNNNSFVQGLNTAKGYPFADGSTWDGRQTEITAVMGVNAPDGRGNATAYITYRNVKPVLQSERDYSSCQLGETATSFQCGGSPTTALGHFFSNDLAVAGLPYDFFLDATSGSANRVRPTTANDVFNFAPFNYYQRPDDQYAAGVFAHYEVSPMLDVYTEIMFMDNRTKAQIAPSGVFGQTFSIPCNSPVFSAQQVATFCTAAGLGPTDSASIAVLRRNVEGGGRLDDLRHTNYRLLIGAKGDLSETWSYDAYAQLGRSVYAENYQNDFSLRRVNNAFNVGPNAAGQLVCLDPAAVAEGCVPYNPFSLTGVTPASLAYLQTPGFKEGQTEETVVSGSLTGAFPGIVSPWAEDSLAISVGAEYRRESLELNTDTAFSTGDLAGQGGPTPSVKGAFDVYELFGEARLPLIQDAPFAKALTLELGYRFSDYSLSGTTDTYKVAGDWRVVDGVGFRGSFQRAVRAPNIVELFTPQAVGLFLDDDPCAGPTPARTAAECARTGVPASLYGRIARNPSNQYNGLGGGNPGLDPEEADTYSVGAVLQPTFAPGLSITVDYYNIKVDNYIQQLDPNLVLGGCLDTGAPELCSLVNRAPANGSLFLGTAGFVDARNVNVGFLKTSGVDVEVNYRTDLSNFGWDNGGGLSFNFIGTWLESLTTNPGIPTTDASGNVVTKYDCAGLYGTSTCGTPNPEWRHRMRVTWNTPVDGLQVSTSWRFFSSVKAQGTSSNPFLNGPTFPADVKLKDQSYFDLAATWRLKDSYSFRLGVNNIFDREPPLVGSNLGGANSFYNGNTYPQVYDALGRYVFAGVTLDF